MHVRQAVFVKWIENRKPLAASGGSMARYRGKQKVMLESSDIGLCWCQVAELQLYSYGGDARRAMLLQE